MRLAEITIVVPTKNEIDNIDRFVASVPRDVDLVVVDSSSDATAAAVLELRPERTTVLIADATIPEARTIGAAAASTPWVLFTDADVEFDSGYWNALRRLGPDRTRGGIVGTKRSSGGYLVYHWLFVIGQRLLALIDIPAATGSNMLVRADVLTALGGFDERLTVNEDTELMFRVAKAGFDVEFVATLAVWSFDHRRLDGGAVRKLLHGVARNAMLYTGLGERLVHRSDWGYWEPVRSGPASCVVAQLRRSCDLSSRFTNLPLAFRGSGSSRNHT